ncbi:MAG: hypothetical protein SVU32_00760 [Candidatus Nanohaloarchaea archaeon]|nr:hypothetical protein [Candidatus Nanohaloarchaea archaeon]
MPNARFITSPVKDKPWTWGKQDVYEELADELGFEQRKLPNGFNGQFTCDEMLHILDQLRDSGVTSEDRERTKQDLSQEIAGHVGIGDGYRSYAGFKQEALYEVLVAVKDWDLDGGDR